MRIQIKNKLRPFSHRPGTCCLIPLSYWEAKIFPAKIFFSDHLRKKEEVFSLPIEGPVKGFTILQDMEKGRIEVFGKGKRGYFRYFLEAGNLTFQKEKSFSLPFIDRREILQSQERLSLGIHKKQDWDEVKKRADMAEIFPFWLRLSQLIPEEQLPANNLKLIDLLNQGDLSLLFQVGFQGILCPRIEDENYLGVLPENQKIENVSALGILHAGAKKIRSLFFQEEKNIWKLLPDLPKEFHAGRLIHLETKEKDRVSIEWSKKELKKVILIPNETRQIQLSLQKRAKSFRLRTNIKEKGKRLLHENLLSLQKGKTLYLDRFMH